MEPNLELAKTRDFGEIISDTFTFLKQNYKGLLRCFFTFCGFFLAGAAVFSILQQSRTMDIYNSATSGGQPTFYDTAPMVWNGLLAGLFGIFSYTASMVTILSYISLYKQNGNVAPTTAQVWSYFKYFYLRVLGSAFIIGLLLGAGFIVCLIPGIYLFPIMGLIIPIMIIENGTFGYAFTQSFTLIKNYWWVTAGTVFILWVIMYFCYMAVLLPLGAASLANVLLRPQNMPTLSTTTIILSAIIQGLSQVFLIVPLIGISLCYFNLNESKEGTSLLERINKFGSQTTDPNFPAEEY